MKITQLWDQVTDNGNFSTGEMASLYYRNSLQNIAGKTRVNTMAADALAPFLPSEATSSQSIGYVK